MNVPKKRQIIIAIIVIVLVTAGIAIARSSWRGKNYLHNGPAVRMDLEDSVLATGILKAFKTVAVGAQVNGQLKTLHVALGAQGKKRDSLLAENRSGAAAKTP